MLKLNYINISSVHSQCILFRQVYFFLPNNLIQDGQAYVLLLSFLFLILSENQSVSALQIALLQGVDTYQIANGPRT